MNDAAFCLRDNIRVITLIDWHHRRPIVVIRTKDIGKEGDKNYWAKQCNNITGQHGVVASEVVKAKDTIELVWRKWQSRRQLGRILVQWLGKGMLQASSVDSKGE
jgi:hypothetical protein